MPLPRLHPLTKTFTDLHRCEVRMEDFVARFPVEQMNEVDRYVEILEKIKEAKALLPKQFQ